MEALLFHYLSLISGVESLDHGGFRAELQATPPKVTVSQAFDLTTMLHCVDWWNARRLESDCNIQMTAVCQLGCS